MAVLIDIVSDRIHREALHDFVIGDPSCGAVVIFEGTVRKEDHPDHGSLAHLFYEAYRDMAIAQMERVAGEARRRFSASRVAIVHRTGAVAIGEAAVVIAVACGHRAEAFDACRWIIDTLKTDVPIWKKNIWEEGEEQWVDPVQPD